MSKWGEQAALLPPLAQELLEIPLDERISVRVGGENVTGFVSDSGHPAVLRLLHAEVVTEREVKSLGQLREMQRELGPNVPIHRICGETLIDITAVVGFYRADKRVSLCVYPGELR